MLSIIRKGLDTTYKTEKYKKAGPWVPVDQEAGYSPVRKT